MTMSTRSSKKGQSAVSRNTLPGIDRMFGRDLRPHGWAIDLTRAGGDADADDAAHGWAAETPDPAMIWVMRGRRR